MPTDLTKEIIKIFLIENNNLFKGANITELSDITKNAKFSKSKLPFMISKADMIISINKILFDDIVKKYDNDIKEKELIVLTITIYAILSGEEKRHYRTLFEELRLRNIYLYLEPYTNILKDVNIEDIAKIKDAIDNSANILSDDNKVLTYKRYKMVYDNKNFITEK